MHVSLRKYGLIQKAYNVLKNRNNQKLSVPVEVK